MTRGVVKEKEAGHRAIGAGFKNVDGFLDLVQKVIRGEITITIFSCFEEETGFTVIQQVNLSGKI